MNFTGTLPPPARSPGFSRQGIRPPATQRLEPSSLPPAKAGTPNPAPGANAAGARPSGRRNVPLPQHTPASRTSPAHLPPPPVPTSALPARESLAPSTSLRPEGRAPQSSPVGRVCPSAPLDHPAAAAARWGQTRPTQNPSRHFGDALPDIQQPVRHFGDALADIQQPVRHFGDALPDIRQPVRHFGDAVLRLFDHPFPLSVGVS